MSDISGIHHVTAICGDPRENLEFYTGLLGMRLVKKSVNQDAPDTYHLFYADADGSPGTDLTFFPFRHSPAGRLGVGLGVEIALAIPSGSYDYWLGRQHRFTSSYRCNERELQRADIAVKFTEFPHALPGISSALSD